MKLFPLLGLGALLVYLFQSGEDEAPPAASNGGTPGVVYPGTMKAVAIPIGPVLSNPRSGRCFSKVDRAGFTSDRIGAQ